MLAAVEEIMPKLKLPINDRKTQCLRYPEESFEFLGYRIGRNYRKQGTGSYIGTRPSHASVQSICRKVSEQTAAKHGVMDTQEMVARLNRMIIGWPTPIVLGTSVPPMLRLMLTRRNGCDSGSVGSKVKFGKYVRFLDDKLSNTYGLKRLAPMTEGFAWTKS